MKIGTKHWLEATSQSTLTYTPPRWEQVQPNMHAWKLIREGIVGLLKRAGRLPALLAKAFRHRQREFAAHALEAERLDRIRHPAKYLGKP
jgi:hypothetical protein